jgi:hypothetical protein
VLPLVLALAPGCECGSGNDPEDGGIPRIDARNPLDADPGIDAPSDTDATPDDGAILGPDGELLGPDGEVLVPDGALVDGDGSVIVVPDGSVLLPDGAIVPVGCAIALCQGHEYECGNCLDDDGDGIIDSADPDCLGPCDNSEDNLDLEIPGIGATCNRDCYFDQDSGSGNDDCSWNLRCDPLGPGTRPSGLSCPYDDTRTCVDTQSEMCLDFCGPLVPNGCDCFGCCEIPGGSGSFVFLGSVPEPGSEPCTIENADDPSSCRPCEPTTACFNACGRCELCLGRTELPPECFPPPPPVDAGIPTFPDGAIMTLPDGGAIPPPDGGPMIDAGPPPPPRCPVGQQACGLPTDPACPDGYYCLTGCCIYFG